MKIKTFLELIKQNVEITIIEETFFQNCKFIWKGNKNKLLQSKKLLNEKIIEIANYEKNEFTIYIKKGESI